MIDLGSARIKFMRKYFFLLVMLGLLVLSFFVFYQARLRYLVNPGLGVPIEKPAASGEIIITYSDPGRSKETLRAVVLSRLVVEDFELDVVEVGGEKKPLLNLNVSFKYNGKDRYLTIPIVDNISFRRWIDKGFKNEGEKSTASLNLEKGNTVNVALFYIPKDVSSDKEVVNKFCRETQYRLCLMYIDLGFGDKPIDFGTYLESVLLVQETAALDYKIAFPDSIFLTTKNQ